MSFQTRSERTYTPVGRFGTATGHDAVAKGTCHAQSNVIHSAVLQAAVFPDIAGELPQVLLLLPKGVGSYTQLAVSYVLATGQRIHQMGLCCHRWGLPHRQLPYLCFLERQKALLAYYTTYFDACLVPTARLHLYLVDSHNSCTFLVLCSSRLPQGQNGRF